MFKKCNEEIQDALADPSSANNIFRDLATDILEFCADYRKSIQTKISRGVKQGSMLLGDNRL